MHPRQEKDVAGQPLLEVEGDISGGSIRLAGERLDQIPKTRDVVSYEAMTPAL